MNTAVIFQIQSFLILALIYYGVAIRKNRPKHVKVMATAILWDILLILQIELTRSAIAKASRVVENPMMLNIHVSFAVSSVLCYFVLIYSGRKLLKRQESIRPVHKFFGFTAVSLRTLTLITSYFVV